MKDIKVSRDLTVRPTGKGAILIKREKAMRGDDYQRDLFLSNSDLKKLFESINWIDLSDKTRR